MQELLKTPFGFRSTADEVIRGVDLTSQRAIVTGGSSGIGIDTAWVLASTGADVILAVRNLAAGRRVARDIIAATGNPEVRAAYLDMSDPASVKTFVAHWQRPLHLLINNAGIMALPELTRTPEGWEMQFATSFLGHFALTVGL